MRRAIWWVAVACAPLASALDDVAIAPENRIVSDAPAWRELAAAFARQPDSTADFTEKRYFPFSTVPIVLKGEVRVSRALGLSLHYTAPEERVVILDAGGILVRDASGQNAPPDPRAAMANGALLGILRFDFSALEKEFELYGRRAGEAWSIALVPRAEAMRRALGHLHVAGSGPAVLRIELRRSARQHVDIELAAPRPAAFAAGEARRFFR